MRRSLCCATCTCTKASDLSDALKVGPALGIGCREFCILSRPCLVPARDRYAIRGYLDTARKHGLTVTDVIRDAITGNAWMPALPA